MTQRKAAGGGFTLIELLVALAIATILITGIVQLAVAAGGSYRLQQNLGALQENARFAFGLIEQESGQAGFDPEPWRSETVMGAISGESVDALNPGSDRIAFRRWSDRNCFNNDNPVTDGSGHAEFFLLESSFTVTTSGSLALTCRYGPDPGNLTTQINGLGLVQHVSALQALYAEDSDLDGDADRWVNAGDWLDEANVTGLRVALLLGSPDRVTNETGGDVQVLDETVPAPADGRLRRVFSATMAIRGRN